MTVPTHSVTGVPSRPGDPLLQSRFRRALQEPTPSHAFHPRAAGALSGDTGHALSDSRSESSTELVTLLERACSALYVGEKSIKCQRIVLMLDHVLPGAAAEIVREGAHLTVRLYARTQTALQLMTSQRASLLAAMGSSHLSVDVVVVDGAPGLHCDGDPSGDSK